MRTNLTSFQNAIKDVAVGTSKFETALAATEVLSDLYDTLGTKLNELKTAKEAAGTTGINAVDEAYYRADINAVIAAITETLKIKFEGVDLFGQDHLGADITVQVSGFTESKVQPTVYTAFGTIDDAAKGGAPGDTGHDPKKHVKVSSDAAANKDVSTLITATKTNKDTADNNYRLILAGITNLANFDTLARVQKTNTEAAISALEDIDIQEEMINLMQSQILEELSSEALLKIKDSSKYIVNLIRG